MRKRVLSLVGFLGVVLLSSLLVANYLTSRVSVALPKEVEPLDPAQAREEASETKRPPARGPPPRSPPAQAMVPPHEALYADDDDWAHVPLDTDGSSLGLDSAQQNKTTPFNRAFTTLAGQEIRNCLKGVAHKEPPDGGVTLLVVKVALSMQGTGSGYDILDAEMVEGDIDAYRQRCLEFAMTKQIQMPSDIGGEPGKRYKLLYPLMTGWESPPETERAN
jgi:hypothetical protein